MSGQDAKSRRSPTILREQTRAEEAVWRGAADGKLGRLACENFIAQMVQLLHNTAPDTRHLDRSQSEQEHSWQQITGSGQGREEWEGSSHISYNPVDHLLIFTNFFGCDGPDSTLV